MVAAARPAIFEVPNISVMTTFYSARPSEGGRVLRAVRMNNSPASLVYHDIADHAFVTLEHEGQSYGFATFPGGTNKFSLYLNPTGVQEGKDGYAQLREDAVSLAVLLERAALDETVLSRLGRANETSSDPQ